MLSHIPPRTADKLYVYEFFFEKLGVRIAYGYAILTQLTKIEKSSIFNLLLIVWRQLWQEQPVRTPVRQSLPINSFAAAAVKLS